MALANPRYQTKVTAFVRIYETESTLLVLYLKKYSNIRSYECLICFDNITTGYAQEHSLWHCKKCYRVIHLHCVKEWYRGNGAVSFDVILRISMNLPIRWSCPHCTKHIVGLLPTPSCWCGKQSSTSQILQAVDPTLVSVHATELVNAAMVDERHLARNFAILGLATSLHRRLCPCPTYTASATSSTSSTSQYLE